MTIRITANARNAALAAVAARVDGGGGPGQLRVYTGSQPANSDTAPSGTLLATFVLAQPAFELPSNGSIAIDADPDLTTVAVASGTAGWFRITDASGQAVFDGSIGTSGTDFTVNSTTFAVGLPISLLAATITFPA